MGEAVAEAPGPPRRRRRRLIALAVVVVIVAAVGLWANSEAGGYYAYLPGSAPTITTSGACRPDGSGALALPGGTPCARLVIAPGHSHLIDGRLLMVDVLVGKATPLEYLEHRLHLLNVFHQGAQLISNAAVLGTTPASQYNCQDSQYMATASQTAPVLALDHLGYQVTERHLGARVFEVVGGTGAARGGIKCDDLITAVDGTKVLTANDLSTALKGKTPGTVVKVTVQRPSSGDAKTLTLPVTLGRVPKADAAHDPNAGFLGIESMTQATYDFPFHVSVEVGDIGGPSAGLALTLALLDALSDGQLTGGHVIAATGEISSTGAVLPIGGVKQKTVAVERAGARLFLVPPANYRDAKSQANSSLRVEAVSSLSQALDDIKAFGGHIPPTHPPSSAAS